MKLTYQELSAVLAGLRLLQDADEETISALPHFDDCEPMTVEQLDKLCERINLDCELTEVKP